MARTMTRKPTTYSPTEIKKMSTERLMTIYMYIFGSYPATFVRSEIRQMVSNAQIDWQAQFEATLPERDDLERQRQMARRLIESMTATQQFTYNDIKSMRQMKKAGYGYRAIANVYGKSPAYIKKIVDGKMYKDVR